MTPETSFTLMIILDILAKGAVILLLTLLIDQVFKKTNASLKHLLWSLSLAAVFSLPITAFLLPSLELPILSSSVFMQNPSPNLTSGATGAAEGSITTGLPEGSALIVIAYLAGLCLVLIWQLVGRLYALRIRLAAKTIHEEDFVTLLSGVRRQLRIHRKVAVMSSDLTQTPFSCGIIRPAVIFPEGIHSWPESVIRSALVHELSHIKRLDLLWRTVAQIVCCFHWVNPLSWLGFQRLMIEQEIACDDLVLQAGTKPSEYARDLLAVAKMRQGHFDFAVAAFGRRLELKDRLLEILKPKRSKKPLDLVRLLVVLAAALAVIVPLSAVDIWIQAIPSLPPVKTEKPPEILLATPTDFSSSSAATVKPVPTPAQPDKTEEFKKAVAKKVAEMKEKGVPEKKIQAFVSDAKKKMNAQQKKEAQKTKAKKEKSKTTKLPQTPLGKKDGQAA